MANKCNLSVVKGHPQTKCLYKLFKWERPLWGLRGSYVLSLSEECCSFMDVFRGMALPQGHGWMEAYSSKSGDYTCIRVLSMRASFEYFRLETRGPCNCLLCW